MENSLLFNKIPKEIRDTIFEMAVTQEDTVTIYIDKNCACAGSKGEAACDQTEPCITKILSGLPSTCRQAREECMAWAFSKNNFHITTTDPHADGFEPSMRSLHVLKRGLYFIKPEHAAGIKHVTVNVGFRFAEVTTPHDFWYLFTALNKQKAKLAPNAVMLAEMDMDFLDIGMVSDPILFHFVLPVGDAAGGRAAIDATIAKRVAAIEVDEDGKYVVDQGEPGPRDYAECGNWMKWFMQGL